MGERFGILTWYNGREYRSQLEAKTQMFGHAMGWQFDYEPIEAVPLGAAGCYKPDFLVDGELFLEMKPHENFAIERKNGYSALDRCRLLSRAIDYPVALSVGLPGPDAAVVVFSRDLPGGHAFASWTVCNLCFGCAFNVYADDGTIRSQWAACKCRFTLSPIGAALPGAVSIGSNVLIERAHSLALNAKWGHGSNPRRPKPLIVPDKNRRRQRIFGTSDATHYAFVSAFEAYPLLPPGTIPKGGAVELTDGRVMFG